MSVLETKRLKLRLITLDDGEFILELLNDPDFVRFVGDKGVRTIDDACRYILSGPKASYDRYGFGLWLVELQSPKLSIGICGLLKREPLEDADLGFAFLPRFRSCGYARESASAVLQHGREVLGLKRIVAITDRDNAGSIRVLEKLGMSFERMIRMSPDQPEIELHASEVTVDHEDRCA
ncbi:MAG: GNAT family N-acetyltransferase [Gemmatimonadales bacterium]|nr:GNAT family N-acetyltransferase [Gemmatimonadales bacterium]